MSSLLARRLLPTLAAAVAMLVWTAAANALTVGDAYATQGANSCAWTIGTNGVEKTLTFSASPGTFTLTSFLNKLASPAKELIQGGVSSPEFRFAWDGTTLTGASGGWSCSSGTASTVTVGGQSAIQVDVVLTRSLAPTTVKVTKHYVVFPSESLIREWTDYANVDTSAHTLGTPSVLEQHVLGSDTSAGRVTLQYMTGAICCDTRAWTIRSTPLNSAYVRSFDSYDTPYCVDSGSTPATCTQDSFHETSSSYMPWFDLVESTSNSGVIAGFDYFGRWRAPIGASNGGTSLAVNLPNYSSAVAGGTSVTAPQAFVMTYKGDLDDMGNRLLDWQYRYLWDYTRSPYFPGVAAPGNWCAGTQWCGNWDQQGVRQKIFNLSDRERAIGIDVDWRDNGWWNVPGDWAGPDFKLTNDFLAKSGIKSIVYYPAYGANTASQTYQANPSWFANGSPCGYTERLGDMAIPAFETWMKNLLVGNAQSWGDYMFRNDACPILPVTGATQLAEDQAYRRILQYFLDQRTGGAFFSVDSGGNELGWDYVRLSSLVQSWDAPNPDKAAIAGYLFPIDKMSGDPNAWSAVGYCSRSIWRDLGMNLSFYSNADANGFGNGDTVDPTQIECARKLVDDYHYLAAQGVVGRWVRQYHPTATDGTANWFQRLSQDGSKGTIHRFGGDTASSVTVYPKALNAASTYDVRYQFTAGSSSRTGSDLMTNGITFPSGLSQGEIVYLNLPQHPGAGTDATAPSAPTGVTATAATNVNYAGVDVRWTAGSDGNWVSYYNVYRDGVLIGKTSNGTYFFDHTPAASPYVQYGVQTADGDGNTSAIASSTPAHATEIAAVDDASLTYSGYAHLTGQVGNYADTLSGSSTSTDSASYSFTGSAVAVYVKLGPNEGKANIKIDGTTDAVVDLFAPDNLDAIVPIYTKTWAAAGSHTIAISPDGTKNAKSTGTTIYLDGLQIVNPAQSVAEDSAAAVTYSGSWTHATEVAGTSNGDVSSASTAGAYAQYTFTSSRVRLTGRYCASCGEADVYIDGVFDARIDLWGDRGTQVDRTLLYDRSFVSSGTHTIKVVATGTKNLESSGTSIYLDSFQTDNGGTSGVQSGPYGSAVAADNPAVWYRLEEGSGATTAADTSGHGVSGTVHGGVTLGSAGAVASEPTTKGATFDGSSGWIDVGNPTSLQVGNGTVEAWIKTTNSDTNYHAVAIKWYAYSLFVHNGRIVTYDWGANAERDSGVNVADGNWHHVVLTFQSGVTNGTTLYVDGTARLTTTITVANQTHNAIVSSGATDVPQQYFPGTIDEVAYYGGVLSAARVQAHWNAAHYGGLIAADGPAAWYRLADATGSTTAADASGNGVTGTVHGSVSFGATGALAHDADKAAAFDGSSGWIDVGNPTSLQVGNGTVEAWIKTTNSDTNYHAVAIKWYAYSLFVHNGRIVTYDWGANAERDSGVTIADGNWHHVVLTFQSGVTNGTTLYVDGTARLTTTITVANQTHNAIVSSGATDVPQQYFPGTIDEVAYYGKLLSAAQVGLHYSAGTH